MAGAWNVVKKHKKGLVAGAAALGVGGYLTQRKRKQRREYKRELLGRYVAAAEKTRKSSSRAR